MDQVYVTLAPKEDDADIEVKIPESADTQRGHIYLTSGTALRLAFDLLATVINSKKGY